MLANAGATQFEEAVGCDPLGNVADVWTTVPAGTDYQAFCYEISCSHMTKPHLLAGRGGGDDVADLHLLVGDDHPVNE